MTAKEWKRRQAELTILIDEFEREAAAAIAWYAEWKERQTGFQCTRRPMSEAAE